MGYWAHPQVLSAARVSIRLGSAQNGLAVGIKNARWSRRAWLRSLQVGQERNTPGLCLLFALPWPTCPAQPPRQSPLVLPRQAIQPPSTQRRKRRSLCLCGARFLPDAQPLCSPLAGGFWPWLVALKFSCNFPGDLPLYPGRSLWCNATLTYSRLGLSNGQL